MFRLPLLTIGDIHEIIMIRLPRQKGHEETKGNTQICNQQPFKETTDVLAHSQPARFAVFKT